MPVRLTYHGSPNASSILQEGFKPGRMFSVAPGQVFSTPNVNFASGYGNPVKMATSTNAFSLPSVNLSSGQIGREVIQSPQNATRGMQLAQMAEKLKNVSPTAARLLGGETIRGIGASSIGRSALVRTVGTLLGGTVAGTAGILTSPYIAIANHLYGPNVGKAQDFVGTFGEAMPFSGDADMYPEYFSYLGKQGIPQALSDTVLAEPTTGIMNIETPKGFDYNFDENVLKEEEDAQYNLDNKRSFNMDGIVQNLKNYLPFIGDKSITGTLTRGIGQFFNNIGDRISNTPQYQQYTPGYNYGNLNPNLIDDFYDPATGLNRFDRAKTLFGQSRTLSEFLSKRRETAAAEAESQRIDAANRANVQSYIDSGGQSYDSQAQGTMYSDAASLGLE
jgi:hypothetical protein